MLPAYAAHSVSLPAVENGELPRRVHLMPIGTFSGKNGLGPYTVRDQEHLRQIVAATQAYHQGAPAPIDYDHQTLRAKSNGKPVPAAAWMTGFEIDEQGLWAVVADWTDDAAGYVRDRAYRFVSPVFWHSKDGTVQAIWHAALTNLPNLDLVAYAHQEPTQGDIVPMEDLTKLREALGLPDGADVDAIAAHAQTMTATAKAATAALSTVTTALGLDTKATADQVAAAAQDMAGKAKVAAASQLASGEFVPMAQYAALSQTVAALQAKMVQDEAGMEVEKAMAAGKIAPAIKDWAVAYASQNLDGFRKFAEAAPVIVTPGGSGIVGGLPAGAGGLTEAEIAVCSQMGLSEADFLKSRKGAA